jgi:hypothetical protein
MRELQARECGQSARRESARHADQGGRMLSGTGIRLAAMARRAATVAVALPLMFLVLMIGSAVAGAAAMLCVLGLGDLYSPNLAWDLAVGTVAAVLAGLYGAVPVTRFMLRVFPLRADRRPRWGLMCMLVLAATITLASWRQLHPVSRPDNAPGPQSAWVALVVVIVLALVLLRIYATRGTAIAGPQVLYLRRFRSFSDRAVYRFLLRAVPSGACVTALVSASGGPRDLDPLTIAFDGLRLLHPLDSMPRTFASPDAEWPDHVRTMMLAAQCIVVDGSADSVSMRHEYRLIETLGLGPRTIVVTDAEHAGQAPAFSGALSVAYRRSRWPSAGRALIWLALLLLYGKLSALYPIEYSKLGLLFFLLLLPALAQRSVRRDALVQLKAALRARVPGRPRRRMLRLLGRWLALGAGGAAAVLGSALALDKGLPPLPSTDPAAWDAVSRPMSIEAFSLGVREVQVPVPAGFLDPKNLHLGVLRQLKVDDRGGLRTLAIFLPYRQVARMVFDPGSPFDERLVVLTPTKAEALSLGLEDFARFAQAQLEHAGEGLPPGSSEPALVAAGDRYLSLSFVRPFKVVVEGRQVVLMKACLLAWGLVQGKLLGFHLCRDAHSDRDADWVRAVSGRWVEELLRLNPATPPLDAHGLGFAVQGSVELSVASGLRRTGQMWVTEVVAGSPAAAAGLEAGDEIVAANDVAVSTDSTRVVRLISTLPPGARLTLTLRRDAHEQTVEMQKP